MGLEITTTLRDEAPDQSTAASTSEKVGSNVLVQIGANLRAQYSEVLNEPVPEKFRELLARLESETADDAQPAQPTIETGEV